jgi:predicted dithiol-disulfide oxidoreductase (DUF899 family)
MAGTRSLHRLRFPGETSKYRQARNGLLKAEIELRRSIEAVAAQRRRLPLGGEITTDYVFDRSAPGDKGFGKVRLSELFSPGKDTLFVYSFMFPENTGPRMTPCPSCTSIIDAIDGAARHITDRIDLAVVAKAPIARFRRHADSRGWRDVQLLSSAKNTYNRDYHSETEDGHQIPIATVFARRGGKIHHFWSSELFFAHADPGQDMRHVDFIWPMWSIFDLTPEGRGTDWSARLSYR